MKTMTDYNDPWQPEFRTPEWTWIPLKASDSVVTKTYDDVSLYFSDIVGFTAIGKKSTPTQIMKMMDELFKLFDSIITKSGFKRTNLWLADTAPSSSFFGNPFQFKCTKVETIGDAYFVVSGCPEAFDDHAAEVNFWPLIGQQTSAQAFLIGW